MTGSVTKYTIKGPSRLLWQYRIDVGRDEEGRRIRMNRAGFKELRTAVDAMHKHMNDITGAESATLTEWLIDWLNTSGGQNLRAATLEQYRRLANYIVNAKRGLLCELAQTRLSNVTPQQLDAAFYALSIAESKRCGRIFAVTLSRITEVVSVALDKAFRFALIPSNPMLKVMLPRVGLSDSRSPDLEQTCVTLSRFKITCQGGVWEALPRPAPESV